MFKETHMVDTAILAKYQRFILSTDALIGDIPWSRKLHSGGVIYKSENKKLEVPSGHASAEVLLKVEDVYDFNLEKICVDIFQFCQDMLKQFTEGMFDTLTQVTDFTGNVVDGKGKGLSYEMLLEILEKLHIDFDDEGNPKMPTMVINPGMEEQVEKLKQDEALYKGKIEEIIKKKKDAYYAEKGSRGLSRID